ncbi:hypothetical protein [Nocardia sp. NBC_01377]|uniref:hypothetical protein n=1 Tax=Nocardia sp. NBC_01377 TaxID=2903595 RepID=UPI003868587F
MSARIHLSTAVISMPSFFTVSGFADRSAGGIDSHRDMNVLVWIDPHRHHRKSLLRPTRDDGTAARP